MASLLFRKKAGNIGQAKVKSHRGNRRSSVQRSPAARSTRDRLATQLRARGRRANFVALQGSSIAARRATLSSIVLLECAVGRLDLLPGRTARANIAAHWVGAKEVVGDGY